MDDDDYYDKDFCRCIEALKKNDLDILCYDKTRHLKGENSKVPILNFKNLEVLTGREFLIENGFPWGPTSYIFRRSLMVDNDVWFTEHCSSEDVDWCHRLPYYAKSMQFIPVIGYHYVLEPESTTGAEWRSAERVYDRLRAGFRVSELCMLYDRMPERNAIMRVASATTRIGLIFLCGLKVSPIRKRKVISSYVTTDMRLGGLDWVKSLPGMFACFSTLISPVFRLMVIAHRKLRKRL